MKKFIILAGIALAMAGNIMGQQPPPAPATQAQVNSGSAKNVYVSPAMLAATGVSRPVPSGIKSIWDGANLVGYTNGQTVSLWPDTLGANPLNMIGATFSDSVYEGHPGVILNQATSICSNANYFANAPGLNTNVTMIFVIKPLKRAADYANEMILTCGGPGDLTAVQINACENSYGGFSAILKTNGIYSETPVPGNREVEIYTVRYDGTYFDAYYNGGVSVLGSVGANNFAPTAQAGGIGLRGHLYIANYAGLQRQPAFAVMRIEIYSRALTYAELAARHADLCSSYNRRADVILVGDSITRGGLTGEQAGSNIITLASLALPQLQFAQSSGAANDSFQMLTNMTAPGGWLSIPRKPGALAILYSAVNDVGHGYTVNQTLTNYLIFAALCRSNNIRPGIATPVSWLSGDTTGARTNLTIGISNLASSFDLVVPYGAIASLGTNFACTNVFFSADNVHPKSAAKYLMAQTLVNSIASAISPFSAAAIVATNAPANGYTMRYTNGNWYWAP